MPTSRSSSFVAILAFGAVALSLSSAAFAQGLGSRYGGYVDYDEDEDEYAAPVPPRPVPDYRRGAVETIVTTTRRVVTSRSADDEYDEPEAAVAVRRVIVPAPIRRAPPPDILVGAGGFPQGRLLSRPPVYKSEPVYAPAPAWREELVAPRPRPSVQPVIIEERRVETTRRILAPAPLD